MKDGCQSCGAGFGWDLARFTCSMANGSGDAWPAVLCGKCAHAYRQGGVWTRFIEAVPDPRKRPVGPSLSEEREMLSGNQGGGP